MDSLVDKSGDIVVSYSAFFFKIKQYKMFFEYNYSRFILTFANDEECKYKVYI